jgi:hypothetical protein
MNRAAEEAGSYPWYLSLFLSKAINLVFANIEFYRHYSWRCHADTTRNAARAQEYAFRYSAIKQKPYLPTVLPYEGALLKTECRKAAKVILMEEVFCIPMLKADWPSNCTHGSNYASKNIPRDQKPLPRQLAIRKMGRYLQ